MATKIIIAYFFLYISILNYSIGQNTIGQSNLRNFTKQDYNAGLQNWDIKINESGVYYFANNEGMLTYDGKNWKLFSLPNQTIVRSILISKSKKVYVGGQDEIGYFEINKNGLPIFKSIKFIIPKQYQKFADVWDIVEFENRIFFRTRNYIFVLEKDKMEVLPANSEWIFMQSAGEFLIAQDRINGMFELINSFWTKSSIALPFKSQITGFHKIESEKYIISTLSDGLWFLNGKKLSSNDDLFNNRLKNARIYKSYKIEKDRIALATSNEGVFIVDLNGNLVQNISEKEGLLDNNVLSIFKDNKGDIWAGLNNGISQISLSTAVKLIKPLSKNASVYNTIVHQNNLYIATSSGLFYCPLQSKTDLSNSNGSFSLIPGTEGQNWNLSLIKNQLFLGHHEGAFMLSNGELKKLKNQTGYWKFLSNPITNQVLAGTYQGIVAITESNSNIFLEKFNESSRFIESDNMGNIWVSHPYHGIFRIDIQKKVHPYTSKNGLPFDTDNYIFKINNQIIATTKKGIYRYNYVTNSFFSDPTYKETLNKLSIRYISEDMDGNLWFIHNKSVGILDKSLKNSIIYNIPELENLLVNGFENIYAFNKNNIFIGGENGVFHINYENYKKIRPKLLLNFSQVKVTSDVDSTLYGGFKYENFENSANVNPEIPYNFRNIFFDYTSNLHAIPVEYAHQLIGFEKKWSNWSTKNENYYTNLSEGKYEFMIKARNNFGDESQPISYHFTISPPWYRSIMSYLFYTFIILYCLFLLRKWQKKKFLSQKLRFEKEQSSLKKSHELEMSKTELDFKNLALSDAALRLLHKAEILSNIKSEIDTLLHKSVDKNEFSVDLKKMLRTLEAEVKDKLEWQSFSQSFDLVHGDFITRLKNNYPQLTANDLKTCAMIKMNLSSKEIAQILNITLKGVELNRYRIRKKLDLSSSVNLFDFLLKI
ncbi:MAG: triple tyrosine motif-containing protein [Bacteroidota bacterium]